MRRATFGSRSSATGATTALDVQDAVLTRFTLEELDSSSDDLALLRFVAAPASVAPVAPTDGFPARKAQLMAANWKLEIGSMNMTLTASVGPIAVDFDAAQNAAPVVRPFRIAAATVNPATRDDLAAWAASAGGATSVATGGTLEILAADLQTTFLRLDLLGLQPYSGLDPFTTDGRVAMEISATGIDLQ